MVDLRRVHVAPLAAVPLQVLVVLFGGGIGVASYDLEVLGEILQLDTGTWVGVR